MSKYLNTCLMKTSFFFYFSDFFKQFSFPLLHQMLYITIFYIVSTAVRSVKPDTTKWIQAKNKFKKRNIQKFVLGFLVIKRHLEFHPHQEQWFSSDGTTWGNSAFILKVVLLLSNMTKPFNVWLDFFFLFFKHCSSVWVVCDD